MPERRPCVANVGVGGGGPAQEVVKASVRAAGEVPGWRRPWWSHARCRDAPLASLICVEAARRPRHGGLAEGRPAAGQTSPLGEVRPCLPPP